MKPMALFTILRISTVFRWYICIYLFLSRSLIFSYRFVITTSVAHVQIHMQTCKRVNQNNQDFTADIVNVEIAYVRNMSFSELSFSSNSVSSLIVYFKNVLQQKVRDVMNW